MWIDGVSSSFFYSYNKIPEAEYLVEKIDLFNLLFWRSKAQDQATPSIWSLVRDF